MPNTQFELEKVLMADAIDLIQFCEKSKLLHANTGGLMAEKEVPAYSKQTFESIKHVDENGNEFWYARELQNALEYVQ